MTLLAGTNYDPAAAVSKSVASNIAFTALDATNLRATFTGPANGYVLVKIRCVITGSTSVPQILLGILDGATVKLRMAPIGGQKAGAVAAGYITQEVLAVVPVTPGNSYTWDAAYGVEDSVTSTNIKYGGPNNTTTTDAWGGFSYEIHDCPGVLGAILYDPSTAATKSTSSLLAQTAIDATNARVTVTAPASGNVEVRISALLTKANTAQAHVLFGVLNGATVMGRQAPIGNLIDTTGIANREPHEACFTVTGLTPGNSYSFDVSYGVEIVGTGGTPIIGYGGPNNTTGDDAYGALACSVWSI